MNISYSAYDGSSLYFLEKYWSTPKFLVWLENYWTSCIWIGVIYVILVFWGRYLMQNKKPYDLRGALFAWNISLAIFSIIGLIRMLPELVFVLEHYGFNYSVCSSSFYQSHAGIWGAMFALSKVVELVDTLFIVLRKQPLIFLHWYHHVITLWVCWYSATSHLAVGRWYAVMNYFVHSIMYTYYGFRSLRFRPPKWVNIIITSLQIIQMVIGTYATYTAYVLLNSGIECHASNFNLISALVMYISFFILFADYFYKAYVGTKPRVSKSSKQNGAMNGSTEHSIQNGFSYQQNGKKHE